MARGGEQLINSDRALTHQRRPTMPMGRMLGERFHWARMYGRVRGADV